MHRLQLVLGTTADGPVRLDGALAAAHRTILAVTGMGKSKLLCALALQIMNQGAGFAFLDPHGDAADDLLALLIAEGFFRDARAYERLLYIDLSRDDAFPALNVLNQPYEAHKIASSTFEAWTRVWPDLANGAAPMLATFAQYGSYVLAVTHEPLTQLLQLLTDETYRAAQLLRVHDPVVREFFARLDAAGGRSNSQVESTLRRLSILAFNPALRFSLGQPGNVLQWRRLMDTGVSVLINLGGREADVQRLLGALISTSLEEAALSRSDIPEERRLPYHYLLDEFSMFSAHSAASLERVLALTRKYGLSLTLVSQTLAQVPHELRSALQNTLLIALRLGADDASWAAERLLEYDETKLKVSPSGSASWMSATEQTTRLAREIMALPPRMGMVRVGAQTLRFQTLGIPTPRCTREQLAQVKDHYAHRLLTSRSVLESRERHAQSASSLSLQLEPPVDTRSNSLREPSREAASSSAELPVLRPPPHRAAQASAPSRDPVNAACCALADLVG